MRVELQGTSRHETGKGVARRLRREGRLPAVLYGRGQTIPLTLNPVDVLKILREPTRQNVIIGLTVDEGAMISEHQSILRDIQRDPVTGQLLHVDLLKISMDTLIEVHVPIKLVGSVPVGVTKGGSLRQVKRELSITCLPSAIPDQMEVDASSLDIGDAILVRDISRGSEITVLDDPDSHVASVSAPYVEEPKPESATPESPPKEPST